MAAAADRVPSEGTRLHGLLLRALVGPCDGRDDRWRQWRAQVELSAVDDATFPLLPLAWRRFADQSASDAERLAGIYRHSWYRNRMLVRSATRVLTAFDDAGIEHLVMKGAALSVTAYHDWGTRPLGDVDILVRTTAKDRAVALLVDHGWQPDSPVPAEMLRVHHAFNVSAGPLASVDLHWGILYLDRNPVADERAWARSVTIELDGVATRALGPTDQLLHALVHAEDDDLRWVVDVTLLIDSGVIDWGLLCEEAVQRRVVAWVRRRLATAAELTSVDVPTSVLGRLGAAALNPWDRVVQRALENPARRGALATRAVDTFARRTRGLNPAARARAVSPYLAQISGATPLHRSLGVLTSRLVHPTPTEVAP